MLNILCISHSAQMNGSEQSLLLLVRYLDKSKFFPVVILPKDGPLKQALEPYAVVEIVSSLRPWLTSLRGLPLLVHQLVFVFFILWSIIPITKIVYKYNIHVLHTNSSVIISGGIVAKILNLPHIWHIREILSASSLYSTNSVFGISGVIRLIRLLSTVIITNSKSTQSFFLNVEKKPFVKTVYNCVDFQKSDKVFFRKNVYEKFGITQNAFLVGQAGHITYIKGYDILFEAALLVKRVIPNVFFVGVGGTPKPSLPYKNELLNRIDLYGVSKHFKLLDYQSDLAELMSVMDVFVLASRCESFGRVLAEASFLGKPIIGTNVGGIPEIIIANKSGIIIPSENPQKLAQAIIAIWSNPSAAKGMGKVGRDYVRKKFSVEKYIDDISDLYCFAVKLHKD